MKRRSIFSMILAVLILLPCLGTLSACDSGYDVVLNVYNWGALSL